MLEHGEVGKKNFVIGLPSFIFTRSLSAFFQVVPAALEVAMEEDVEFRQGLPLDYLTFMGVQNSDKVISRLFCVYTSLPVNILPCLRPKLTKLNNILLVCTGGPTQDKILHTNRDPDEKAHNLCSC